MALDQSGAHVLMVSFPGQGHINPLLRLAKRLASKGLFVTFSTTHHIIHMIQNSTGGTPSIHIGAGQLHFDSFSDGWEDDDLRRLDLDAYLPQLETVARRSFTQLVQKQSDLGMPVSCIISNPFVPWASEVAADMGIPCALLWVQSSFVYSAYYHYFHNLASFPTAQQPDITVQLPGLPTLESDEIPSFLHPLCTPHLRPLKNVILGQFKNLRKCFSVLVDSFEELERESLEPLPCGGPIIRCIGPLYKWNSGEGGVRADMWSAEEECMQWLDSKPDGSVVYVSFGSIVFMGKKQMEEIARGLLNSGHPFLWVVKPPPKEFSEDGGTLPAGFTEEAGDKGMVVQWCPQDRVLAHPSLACFVTHCGWNSCMEVLSCGVPIVAAPQWGDQVTNAKFLTDVYGVGVRLLRSENDLNTLSGDQVVDCITQVTRGSQAEQFRKNAFKWKRAADEAAKQGGSSYTNLDKFVEDIQEMNPMPHTSSGV